jgi:hypothetical protein
MDQDRDVHWDPQTLQSPKDPESKETPRESSTTRPLVHSKDPEERIPSPTPTRPNVPDETQEEQEERNNPPDNTLRSLIRQTLQSRQPQPQPQSRPPLSHQVLAARQAKITFLSLALELRFKIHAHGSGFCEEALQALRQIGYVLQLVENHMQRHGGRAAGGLEPEKELRELREQIGMILVSMREVEESVVTSVGFGGFLGCGSSVFCSFSIFDFLEKAVH